MLMPKSVTIIGGGAVGCAIAYELSKDPEREIFLIEKNGKINAENQSSRNSGVIHAGIYYPKSKGPLKAQLCVEGNKLLYEFCEEHDVPHKRTGKLLVATNSLEEEYLDDVLNTAIDNNVPGAKRISGEEARRMEPNVKATAAAYFPTTGIIEPTEYILRLKELAENSGAVFVVGYKVVDIKSGNKFEVFTESNNQTETIETDLVINAAGLYSDDIAKMINPDSPYIIDPVRGEAAKFYAKRRDITMNGMNVYPVPFGFYNSTGEKAEVSLSEFKKLLGEKKVSKTVGIHLTPTFDKVNDQYVVGTTVTIGPTTTINTGKEDYRSSNPPEHYLKEVARFFPNIKIEDIKLHQAGIRAKLKEQYDFIIENDRKNPNFINVVGIDSPGLTSSLAIARYVKELIN